MERLNLLLVTVVQPFEVIAKYVAPLLYSSTILQTIQYNCLW
jgi:hypothetical protein